jgi:hypothetical protein
MKKKILIIKLGQQRDDKSYERLARRKSRLLDFTLAKSPLKLTAALKEDGDVTKETYDTNRVAAYMQEQKDLNFSDYDLVLGCIDRPHNSDDGILAEISKEVERNKFYILCTTNIMERLQDGKVSLLNYLLNIIYGMYVRKYLGIDPEYHESPGCLLDYCFLERDLIAGCIKPVLCEECVSGITDRETAAVLNKELKKISVPFYVRLVEYIKQRTVISLLIAAVASIAFGVISNLIASFALSGFWQGVVSSAVPIFILLVLVAPFLRQRK